LVGYVCDLRPLGCWDQFSFFTRSLRPIPYDVPRAALLSLSAPADNAAMQTEPPDAEPPKRKRRWFQFRLLTLIRRFLPLQWLAI
jgi:hypothetical protein